MASSRDPVARFADVAGRCVAWVEGPRSEPAQDVRLGLALVLELLRAALELPVADADGPDVERLTYEGRLAQRVKGRPLARRWASLAGPSDGAPRNAKFGLARRGVRVSISSSTAHLARQPRAGRSRRHAGRGSTLVQQGADVLISRGAADPHRAETHVARGPAPGASSAGVTGPYRRHGPSSVDVCCSPGSPAPDVATTRAWTHR